MQNTPFSHSLICWELIFDGARKPTNIALSRPTNKISHVYAVQKGLEKDCFTRLARLWMGYTEDSHYRKLHSMVLYTLCAERNISAI